MKNRRKTPIIDTDNQQRENFCETSPEQERNAPPVTVETLQQTALQTSDLAGAYLLAETFAQCEKERVDAYSRPLLEKWAFLDEDGKAIESTDKLYLCADSEESRMVFFWAALDTEHHNHGFDGPAGYCPALIADNNARKIKWEFLKTWCKALGIDPVSVYGEKQEKLFKLTMGACLQLLEDKKGRAGE